ncbi:MAG: hypothetical protein K9L68_13835, partial [Spirochaetales bacterium]|nr:hypothetical protein [Spirochaetales bacterium]
MYKKRILLTNFNRGMVSPRFSGRVDTELSRSAVEEIEGFVVHPDGGLVRRRGTIYGKDGVGVIPGEGVPAFVTFQKRNTIDGYEVNYIAYVQKNGSDYQLIIRNMSTGIENVITNSKLQNSVGKPLFTSGKMNNVYSLLSNSSLPLVESTATLAEKTIGYNPTDYSNVYSLPADFYLDYYLASGDTYTLFESKGVTYLATDDASPQLNYADISKDTKEDVTLTGATAPHPTDRTYVYELPAEWEQVYYIDTDSTEYEIDKDVNAIYTDSATPTLHYTNLEDTYGFDFVYQVPGDFYSADSISPDLEYLVYAPAGTTYLYTNAKPSELTLNYKASIASSFNEYVHIWTNDVSFLVDLSDYSFHGNDEKTDQEISTLFQNR